MPQLGPRLRKLQNLLAMRLGPGALKLPKDVTRIHMRFAQESANGHMGPRKFWRHELVRLKYHNPAVSMTIDRTIPNTEEPMMTIFFAPKDAAKTSGAATGAPTATTSTSGDKVASDYTPTESTESVPLKDRTPEAILQDLKRLTKARVIEPTADERALLEELAEQARRSEKDRELSLKVRAEKKRQEDILAEARGETAA